MNITLTPEQAQLVQTKLQSGRYSTLEDLLAQAFLLLDEWEEQDLAHDPDWVASTQTKVGAAVQSIEANGGQDGETVVNDLLQKFSRAREALVPSV